MILLKRTFLMLLCVVMGITVVLEYHNLQDKIYTKEKFSIVIVTELLTYSKVFWFVVFDDFVIQCLFQYSDETVLVVGGGASAVDVAYFVSKVANKTTISYHDPSKTIPDEIYKKPDIKELTETAVLFEDGTQEEFSVIILATGNFFGRL